MSESRREILERHGLVVVEVGFPPEVLAEIRRRSGDVGMLVGEYVAGACERYMEEVDPAFDPTLEMFWIGDPAKRAIYRDVGAPP